MNLCICMRAQTPFGCRDNVLVVVDRRPDCYHLVNLGVQGSDARAISTPISITECLDLQNEPIAIAFQTPSAYLRMI